jgi:hypothetical protein
MAAMPAYDATAALEELREEAVLPHPVRLRDMILRAKFAPEAAVEMNREFQHYLTQFGEIQKAAAVILEKLAHAEKKA